MGRGVTLYHLITMYLNPVFKKDLHTSFPITLEIRRTLLSWDFDPQLGSDFHCHITRIGSHLFQLSLTFLSQLLSSSSFFTFGFKYSNDSFRCQVKSLFSQAFHAQ